MDVFHKFAIFRGLQPDEAVAVRGIAQEVKLTRDAILFREGDTGDSAFLLMSGQVEVRKRMGGVEQSLATLPAGTLVGEIALLNSSPRTATAVAAEDVRLLKIARDAFHDLTAANPQIGSKVYANMARLLADRLRQLDETFARGAAASAPPAERLKEMTRIISRSPL